MPANDEPSLVFLQNLTAKGAWTAAVSFCAYLLPRREAVWWGCQTLRRIRGQFTPEEIVALDAAEAWVFEPEEQRRRVALDIGVQGDATRPATFLAVAAGWSGGNVSPPDVVPIFAPPHQTPNAVRAAILTAMAHIPPANLADAIKPCIDHAVQLALGQAR